MATLVAPNPVYEKHLQTLPLGLREVYEKVLYGERLSRKDGAEIIASNDLLSLGILADMARRRITPPERMDHVYWIHNYHINITNVCEGTCRFCAFSRRSEKAKEAYFLTIEDIITQVHAYPGLADLSEFHIVSGMIQKLNLDFYIELFTRLKAEFPHVHIKALTAVEIDYLAKLHSITPEEVLKTLMQHGHDSMPGGGAEVFSERVRGLLYADKIPHEEWLAIHDTAHRLGMKSNVTLLSGLGETWEERMDHILYVREQQDKSGGFMTFIPLNCWYDNTAVDASNALTGVENLKLFALSRMLLDNIPYVKGYWIQFGLKVAQVSLAFGVNDLDGTVTQEKISHMAGTDSAQSVTKDELVHVVRQAGKIPVERDTLYNILKIYE
jgi:aminodeoxyfutalosine synthase